MSDDFDDDDDDKGKPSKPVTLDMAKQIHALANRGWLQSRIAAKFDINQGRVSEVLNGKRWPDSGSQSQGNLF